MTTVYAKSAVTVPRISSESRFVGRLRELEVLQKYYESAASGHASVVMLVGEQGIGKSRLLHEFVNLAMQGGATTLQGDTSELEGMPPYLPFLEALGRYIRSAPLDTLREQVQPVSQILGSIFPELADRLGELPAPYPLPPEQMRLRLYEAVGTFIARISALHPVVLALDDLHFADPATLDLLSHIMRSQSGARLLVLGTSREDEFEGNPALQRTVTKLVQQRMIISVMVESLSAGEIEELAEHYLGGPVSPTVIQLLFVQSEGNPFISEELMNSWLEKGELVRESGLWVARAPLEHALPQSIVSVLRQRFTRLSPAIVDHLRVASIIGRTFDLSLLAVIENQESEVLEEHLLQAARAGLIRTEQAGVFTFSHDKIRECLYIEVSTSRRRRLHEAIGRVLESRYSHGSTKGISQLAELAFHFTQSGDRERGVTYAGSAAEEALRASAFKAAVTYYQLALELLHQDDGRRGNLLLGLGEAALLSSAESEAAAACKEALTLFTRSGEREAASRAAHGLGLAQWRQGTLQAARATLEHALALLGDNQSAATVRVLVDLSTLLTSYMDHHAVGMTYAQRALEIALRLGDSSLEAAANRAVAGIVYTPDNDIVCAQHSLERALSLAEAGGDTSEAAECCYFLAHAYYWLGEIRRSFEASSRMIELIERSQRRYHLRDALHGLALIHASQGSWAEAERALERARMTVEQPAGPFPFALLRQVRGFLAFQHEDYETAENELRTAEDEPVGPARLMFFAGLLGPAQVALGKEVEARAYTARLEGLLSRLPPGSLPTAPIMTCLALMALGLGDRERATNLYPLLKAFRGQYYWFLVDRVLGQIATLQKNWDTASLYLDAAEKTAVREGLRPEQARTLVARADLEVACRGPQSITRATEALGNALALFEQLNMPRSAASVRSRLHALSQPSRIGCQSLPAGLTRGEARVLKLLSSGKNNRQIGSELGISEKTVANHLYHIFAKTASENRAAAAAFAIRHRLD